MRIEAGSAAPSSTPHSRSFITRRRCCSASTAALGPGGSSRPSLTMNRGRTNTVRATSTRSRYNDERSARSYEAQSGRPTCAKPVHARRSASRFNPATPTISPDATVNETSLNSHDGERRGLRRRQTSINERDLVSGTSVFYTYVVIAAWSESTINVSRACPKRPKQIKGDDARTHSRGSNIDQQRGDRDSLQTMRPRLR